MECGQGRKILSWTFHPPPAHGATAPHGLWPPHDQGFMITLKHFALDSTPQYEWSVRHRDLYLKIQHSHEKDIHAPGGIVTRSPNWGWVEQRAIVRMQRIYQWKFSVTPSGIEPATFRLGAYCSPWIMFNRRMFPEVAYINATCLRCLRSCTAGCQAVSSSPRKCSGSSICSTLCSASANSYLLLYKKKA